MILDILNVGWAEQSEAQHNHRRLFKRAAFEGIAFVALRIRSAQPTQKTRFDNTGFTLLEILLVLVLMGLAATLIMPRLSIGSGAQDLRVASERLLTLSQVAQQLAMTEGHSIGLSIDRDKKSQRYRYEFLTQQKSEWVVIARHRLLRGVQLPTDFTLSLEAGDSFWQEALDYEADSDSLLEEVVTEASVRPDIYFWSSGEVTPSRIHLCLANNEQCREILYEETGEIIDREFVQG